MHVCARARAYRTMAQLCFEQSASNLRAMAVMAVCQVLRCASGESPMWSAAMCVGLNTMRGSCFSVAAKTLKQTGPSEIDRTSGQSAHVRRFDVEADQDSDATISARMGGNQSRQEAQGRTHLVSKMPGSVPGRTIVGS